MDLQLHQLLPRLIRLQPSHLPRLFYPIREIRLIQAVVRQHRKKKANTASSIISFIPGLLDTIYGTIDAYNNIKGQEIKYTNIPEEAQLTINNICNGRVLKKGPNAESTSNKKISDGELHISNCDTEITSAGYEFGDQITKTQRDISAGVASVFTVLGGLSTITSAIFSLYGLKLPTSVMSSIASVGYTMPNLIRLGKYIYESCKASQSVQIYPQ